MLNGDMLAVLSYFKSSGIGPGGSVFEVLHTLKVRLRNRFSDMFWETFEVVGACTACPC